MARKSKAELVNQAVEQFGMAQEEAEEMPYEQLANFLAQQMGGAAQAEGRDYHPGKEKRVGLTIFQQEGPGGRDDVTVTVNGYTFQIQRGKEVRVPESVVHVLDNAVMTNLDQAKGENGEVVFNERNVRRFNYQVVR